MAQSVDTEITLGTAKLLSLFFGLVAVCALFFGLGYSLGRKSDVALASGQPVQTPVRPTSARGGQGTANPSPMTFYKSVDQKGGNAQLTPASAEVASTPANPPSNSPRATAAATAKDQTSPGSGASDPASTPSASAYYVQVAAVSKGEDAEALVEALKKKQYPAFVSTNSSIDKLLRVQVGPFSSLQDAEGMRALLISDGYNPILKK